MGKFIREVYFKKYIVGTGNVKSLNGQSEYFHVMVTLVDENDVFNAPWQTRRSSCFVERASGQMSGIVGIRAENQLNFEICL